MAKRRKASAPAPRSPELPPALPDDRAQLERAIVLLGIRSRGEDLNPKPRAELIALVGSYPNPSKAGNWKLGLKSVRDDEIFERVG